ncbi:hypothetical protein D5R93_02725 [Actinomyces lilanjuaniae]|uniref:Toxin-antitoxin system HicB family antitoxin n=1 Tax=Actinomyces lilanjuaniae TaxID=2321394 RepID=A0ABN5PNG6_9ACTO|nr:hypothetical protein [Actinomyces lilanjuaniae]AYD89238.1 hypothetical protein D5R93_02725 [Actinomyces lilanjuaniae]
MATLTLSVDADVLRRARIRALERNESVNQYLSDMLERYAGTSQQDAVESLLALADARPASSGGGGRGWSREGLYDV